MGINLLIIGTGKFGRRYAEILSHLEPSDVHQSIDNIVITRTNADAVQTQARTIQENSVYNIIGERISKLEELESVLENYKPAFTAVVAKDPAVGYNIHPPYVAISVKYGIVLCEKPFSHAAGDGKSLQFFELNDINLNNLALELPYVVIYNAMVQNTNIPQHIFNSRSIRFAWITRGSENYVIDDLALHPWSLIPKEFKARKIDVDDKRDHAKINIDYFFDGRFIKTEILLSYDGDLTAFEVDGNTFGIKRKGTINAIIDTKLPLEEVIRLGNDGLYGKELLIVDNPLKQHIVSALNGNPMVGWHRIYESQLFLERLHGYKVKE